jgi:hypothetical protein
MRSDGVRAAAQHPLHDTRRASGSAHLNPTALIHPSLVFIARSTTRYVTHAAASVRAIGQKYAPMTRITSSRPMNWASTSLREPTTFGVSVCSAKLGLIESGLMRVAFRRLLAVLLVAAGLFGGMGITAPTAGALGWGAIAISPTAGRVGYSQGLNSAIVNFTNACGAVAQSIQNTSWGWGWDHSSTGAQNKAVISCSQYGAGCRVAGWICS